MTIKLVMAAERIIAQTSFELKDYESARAARERILALHDRSADPLAWSNARYELGRTAFWADVPEEHTLEKVIAFKEREFGPTHPSLVGPLVHLAILAEDSDDEIESLPLIERALSIMSEHGEQVPMYAKLWTIGFSALEYDNERSGDLAKAENRYRQALDVTTAFFGEQHTQVAWALDNLAGVLSAQDKLEESEFARRRALSIVDAKLGRHHREARKLASLLISNLKRQGNVEEVQALYDRVIESFAQEFGPADSRVMTQLWNLSFYLFERGAFEEAEEPRRKALQLAFAHRKRTGQPYRSEDIFLQGYRELLRHLGHSDEKIRERIDAMKEEASLTE